MTLLLAVSIMTIHPKATISMGCHVLAHFRLVLFVLGNDVTHHAAIING